MTTFVTGGAGFIGSHVADALLAQGNSVTVLDDLSRGRKEYVPAQASLVVADVADRGAVLAALDLQTDCVFHLAAQIDVRHAVEDPGDDAHTNIGGTINVLQTAVEQHVRRFVLSSTGGALYGEPAVLPASEETEIRPLSPYGVSKYCAEQYTDYYHRMFGLETVVLRYANVYGPRQDPQGEAGVIGIFARCILLGQPCIVYGDGEQTRDFVFVDDVVRANVLALEGPRGVYNIGTGVAVSLNNILSTFERIVGRAVARAYVQPRTGEVQHIALNAGKAKHELGWTATVPLEDGLAQTLEWVKGALCV